MATTEPRGLGHSVKRIEDARFIRGRGNYVDDITLPNMLHMELLRSRSPTRASSPSTRAAPPRFRALSPSSPAT